MADVKGSTEVEHLEEALEKLGDMETKSWGAVLFFSLRTEDQSPNTEPEPDVQNNPWPCCNFKDSYWMGMTSPRDQF